MNNLSFFTNGESSDDVSIDDEVSSLDHRLTNEAIAATSAGGMSKSGIGRAAALGMDVGSVDTGCTDSFQRENRHSRFQPSLILKKKIIGLMKKTRDTRELWSSKQILRRQKFVRPNHGNSAANQQQPIEAALQHKNGADLFSMDALASQRSREHSLVNKLGMATDAASYAKHESHSSGSSLQLQSGRSLNYRQGVNE